MGFRDWRLEKGLRDWVATGSAAWLKNHWAIESDELNRMVIPDYRNWAEKKMFCCLEDSSYKFRCCCLLDEDIALRLLSKVQIAHPERV